MLNTNNLGYIQLYIEAHSAAWEYEENTGKTLTQEALKEFVSNYINERLQDK